MARGLGRPFVEGMVARRDWHALDDWTAREGWQVLLVSRFIPVIAFNLIKVVTNSVSVGPILVGPAKPAHILTPSVTARGIVNLSALAAVDAQAQAR